MPPKGWTLDDQGKLTVDLAAFIADAVEADVASRLRTQLSDIAWAAGIDSPFDPRTGTIKGDVMARLIRKVRDA